MLADKNKFLEEAFAVLNRVYYENKLPTVAITIMSSPRSNAHISVQKIWRSDNEYFHELNLSAEHLDRGIERVLASLNHEMVHLFCMENNIKETSNLGRYHNTRFRDEAVRRDLDISYDKRIGWSVTQPTDKFIQTLKDNGLYGESLTLHRTSGQMATPITGGKGGEDGGGDEPGAVGKTKKPSSTRKYQCIKCGVSVRATKDVLLCCVPCYAILVKVD